MSRALSVLIVDDDAWQAELIGRTCERAGFTVSYATDALSAIDAVDETPCDVMVLDVFLGGPTGIALLHELRSHVDLAKLPVIMCSGASVMAKSNEWPSYGIIGVLDKATMHPRDVVTLIKKELL